ncbi:MAG: hypothetical protein MJZ37_06975 [Bacilli bacterium]|nr:hypothetical protein [Bacilli bacterium]
MAVILSRNGVLLGTGGGGSGVNYTAGKNIDITDGVISTEGTIYFDTNEGEKIVVRDLTGSAIGEIVLGSEGVGDRAYFHSYDLEHNRYQFTVDSKGFVLTDSDGNEVTLNGEDLVINGHSFIELFNKVDSIDVSKIHEYTGIAPITVDNTNDTISIDDSDYVKQGELEDALEGKQDKLRAGDHIEITSDNLISVTGTLGKVYSAGDQYINVDNDNDTISLNDENLAKQSDLEGLVSTEELNNYYTKDEVYNKTEVDDRDTIIDNRITTEVNNINAKLDGLHNTEVASTNESVTISVTTGADGTKYYDLSVAGGEGGDTAVQGIAPIKAELVGERTYQISIDDSKYATKTELLSKQDKLKEGDYIDIQNDGTITVTGLQPAGDYATKTELTEGLNGKQDTLTAGDKISIEGNVISVTGDIGKTYTGQAPIQVNDTVISIDDSNYATKDELDGKQDTLTFTYNTNNEITKINGKDIVDNDTTYTGSHPIQVNGTVISIDDSNYATKAEVAGKQPVGDYATHSDLENAVAGKQDKLTAGDYIDITSNTISVTGLQPAGDYATKDDLEDYQPAGDYATRQELDEEVQSRQTGDENLQTQINNKQDQLTAGSHISINNNVISVIGELGKQYTGVAPIKVDNSTNKISIEMGDQYTFVPGENIEFVDNTTDKIVTINGLGGGITPVYNNGLADHDVASVKYFDGMAGNSVLTLNTNDGLTGQYSLIKSSLPAGFVWNQSAGLLQSKAPTGDGLYGVKRNGDFEEIKSSTPTIVSCWDFLSDLLPANRGITRQDSYETTLMPFGNKYGNGFTIPAHAKVQITVGTENGTKLLWQRATSDASLMFSFDMGLNTNKVVNKSYGVVEWNIPALSTDTSYYATCTPTTFYFEVGDTAVNSNELFRFTQNGLAYDSAGTGQVSFRANRLSIYGMYWV